MPSPGDDSSFELSRPASAREITFPWWTAEHDGAGSRIDRRSRAVISMLLGAVAGGLLALHVDVAASLGLATALLLGVVVSVLGPVKPRLPRPPTSKHPS